MRSLLFFSFFLSFLWHTSYSQDTLPVFLKLLTWNIQDFGRSKDKEEVRRIAGFLREYDLVAIQEVVAGASGPKAVARLADELDRMGHNWDYRISDRTDSPPYKTERYAFLWKTDRVKPVGRTWLEDSLPEAVFREPYLGRFQFGDRTVLIANYHARRGADLPEEEIPFLTSLYERYPEDPLILLGDFNLDASNPVFDSWEKMGCLPVVNGEPTTLRFSCEADYFSSSFDNIFLPPSLHILEKGIIDTVGDCANLKESRALSDHVPVWVRCN
ncbi:MAG: endonuclease/exonuclease/phosphatase family protein [Lewinellaceae bacterium]|nr:endonuclease/exonuclease/phosphatase family protein [Lewinellaceae bacterium]